MAISRFIGFSVTVQWVTRKDNIRRVAESFRLDSVEDCNEVFLPVGTEVDQRQVQTHKCPQLMIG